MLISKLIFTALEMLKQSSNENGFYGKQYPESFMTDDSSAEKAALQQVFPKSKRLLCQFHVLQVQFLRIFIFYITIYIRPCGDG